MELYAYIHAKNLATLYFQIKKSEQNQKQMTKILYNLPEGVIIFDKLKQKVVFKNEEFTNMMFSLFGLASDAGDD